MNFLLTNFEYDLFSMEETAQNLLALNEKTAEYGITITLETAYELVVSKGNALKNNNRFEVDDSLLEKLILSFVDSPYLMQHNLVETMEELMEIFMYFKAECFESIQDLELLEYMRKAFDGPCGGSLDLLANLSLSKLAKVYKGIYLPEFND